MLKNVLKENTFDNQLGLQVDQAIYAFNEFVKDKNTDYTVILKELNAPNCNFIIEKMSSIWTKTYLNTIKSIQNQSEIESHIKSFELEVKKMFSKRADYQKWQQYYQYIINYELNKIKNFDQNKENTNLVDQSTLSKCHGFDSAYQAACKKESENSHSYDLAFMLRCHSVDQNPQDDKTLVFDCAFEKCKIEPGKFTNICATAGGAIINFIDVNTGCVVKRFNDTKVYNRTRERYYRIVWTIINNCSFVAGAGLHGDVKLINYESGECVLRIDAHDRQIHTLMFHTKHSNILFSGSELGKAKIWRLDVNSEDNAYDYVLLGQIKFDDNASRSHEAVLSMCMIDHEYLVISTVKENYYVRVNVDDLLVNYGENIVLSAKRLSLNFDLCPDKYDEEIVTNKAIVYKEDYIIMNIAFSTSIYIFEIVRDPDSSEISLNFYSSINFGSKAGWLNSVINLIEDDNRLFVLKATEFGYFDKIEIESNLKKRGKALRFNLPADYKIKTSNKSTAQHISVITHGLLDAQRIFTCTSNVDYIVATSDSNIVTIWSKNLETCITID